MNQENWLKANTVILEQMLKAFGLDTRVAEINVLDEEYEFCIEVAMGNKANKILEYETDIALALASPTGKVRIQVPIPGRSIIGIYVPKSPKFTNAKDQKYKIIRIKDYQLESSVPKSGIRYSISTTLYLLSQLLMNLADKIYQPEIEKSNANTKSPD